MPFVRITLNDAIPTDIRRAIADGVHRGLVSALGVPEADRFQVINERPGESLIFHDSYFDANRVQILFVEIWLTQGRTTEQKAALYKEIAANLGEAGVHPDDVFIVLNEVARENWSFGNGAMQTLDEELLARWGWTPPPGS
jgi:phenylpyruvate tautomerase PptA (4-oxalocrotonate tautomerase family)